MLTEIKSALISTLKDRNNCLSIIDNRSLISIALHDGFDSLIPDFRCAFINFKSDGIVIKLDKDMRYLYYHEPDFIDLTVEMVELFLNV